MPQPPEGLAFHWFPVAFIMKELRVQSKGRPIRAFFAFDPARTGIILCAGEKTGKDKRFYDEMIPLADREFTAHLEMLKGGI
ncbi:type II toxin-antitoxin system RelE/ParE family toxin [Marinobacter sp. ES-1]|uniref:type II toxin-antitoxin system RelE/ParE family toxin n=1 Tax=Marinobacter sp. ES-1 TaxID=1396858 RepID=UPI0039B6F0F4